MDWQLSPYMPALAVSGVIALITSALAWRWRAARGATEIALLALLSGLWSWLYALELSSASFTTALTWAKIEYAFIAGVPTMLIIFAARYTNRDGWIAGRRWLAMTVAPALTMLAVWTNDLHRLYWSEMGWVRSGPVSILKFGHGPLFWAFITYSYACVSVATLLLLQSILRSPRPYRGATAALLVAIAAIWGGNALYLSDLSPWGYLDLTPVASTISGLAITLGIFRLRLFDLLPIAHSAVFAQMGDGVVVIDAQGQVADLNPVAQRTLGQDRSALIGASAEQIFDRWPHLVKRYREQIQLSDEIEISAGAERSWLDLRISPLYDGRGKLLGQVIVWHDITARKLAEAELRTARDAAEAASRAKSAFLATMSHELRTPLSAIMGYCQLLRLEMEGGSTERALLDLATIESASEHLLLLIANLLHVSQIEAGAAPISLMPVEIDVAGLIAEVAAAARPATIRRDNALEVQAASQLGTIRTDRARLRLVLLNLLDNAAKFTEGGTITLSAARERDATGEQLVFQVRDTGVGIAPDEIERLFEVFAEHNQQKQRTFGGARVGLAISRHVCRAMGGDINAVSAPDRGTTVTVRLPAL
jgi:PAS domain S-box-containing protein